MSTMTPPVKRATTWICVVMAVISAAGAAIYLLEIVLKPTQALVGWAGGVGIAAVLVLIGIALFPKNRVPWRFRWLSIGFGAFFATTVAGLNPWQSSVTAPFGEELTKLAITATLLWMIRGELRGPLDGLIVGYFTGLGFEAFEDTTYVINLDDASQAWTVLAERALIGFGLHNVFAGLAGMGMALLLVRGRKAWGTLLGFLAAAIALHFVWDNVQPDLGVIPTPLGFDLPIGVLLVYLLFLGVFAVALIWARRHDDPAQRGTPANESGPAVSSSATSQSLTRRDDRDSEA